MKKTLKKFAAVGLSLTSVMGLVACGSNSGNQDATKATVDWANSTEARASSQLWLTVQ